MRVKRFKRKVRILENTIFVVGAVIFSVLWFVASLLSGDPLSEAIVGPATLIGGIVVLFFLHFIVYRIALWEAKGIMKAIKEDALEREREVKP